MNVSVPYVQAASSANSVAAHAPSDASRQAPRFAARAWRWIRTHRSPVLHCPATSTAGARPEPGQAKPIPPRPTQPLLAVESDAALTTGLKKPAQIQILNLNFKIWKNPKKFLKILQVATNLMVSNFFKYSFI